MKKVSFILALIVMTALPSYAALINNGDGTITDTSTNLMWLQDVKYAMTTGEAPIGRMTWDNAMNWAGNLVFAGYNDWRLPGTAVPDSTCDSDTELALGNCEGSEMGHMFYINGINAVSSPGDFINLTSGPLQFYWSSTEFSPAYSYYFRMTGGDQNYEEKGYDIGYAWAVRNISVVPEPISSLLFLSGGALMAGRRFMKCSKI